MRSICFVTLIAGSLGSPGAAVAQTGDAGSLAESQQNDVDVSLGRQEVKDQVAAQLGIKPADVPLSVRLSEQIARDVCAMEELGATDTNRSCTATKFIPALAEAASKTPR